MDINLNPDITEEKQTAARTAKEVNCLIKTYPAFIGASWIPFYRSAIPCVGLWNSIYELNEGYYFTVLLFGLLSAISVQKEACEIDWKD
jgi:uncharacterized membrane protein YiaA